MSGASYSPFLPLVAYAESLCSGARVLFVGSARSEIPQRLVERGARLVHVCDEQSARRAEAAQRSSERAITFGALNDGSFALREGFFELVLVENLSAHPDRKSVVASVARLLAPRGAALIATPNPEVRPALLSAETGKGVDYYALYDAVAAEFSRVRMLGQVPFVGYAVVDFATEGEPAVVFDASLVSSHAEEPDYFVAAAGEKIATLDAYAVIQLPSRAVLGAASAEKPAPRVEEAEPRAAVEARDAERARLEAWIKELEARGVAADERADAAEAELDELRERHANLEQSQRREAEALVTERDRLKAEAERHHRQKHDLGELVQAAQAEARAAQAELATAREKAGAGQTELKALRAELASAKSELTAAQARLVAAQSELATAQSALATAQAELGPARAELAAARSESSTLRDRLAALLEDGAAAEDLRRLEAQLSERGEHVRKLERDLREAERTGRELLRRLERAEQAAPAVQPEASASAPIAPAVPQDEASRRLAELEAERVVLTWSLEIAKGERAALPGQFGG